MSQSPESGRLAFSHTQIAVGLQALAVACLVAWLVRDASTTQLTRKQATKQPSEVRRVRLTIIAVVVSFLSMALGVADLLARRDDDCGAQDIWPQEAESHPLELWDQAWEMFNLWTEVAEPLMPDKVLHKGNNLYNDYHVLMDSHRILDNFCFQLDFISLFRSTDPDSPTETQKRRKDIGTCNAANGNLIEFERSWQYAVIYFSTMYLGIPMQQLAWAGYRIENSQKLKEATPAESSWYGFSRPEGAGIADPGYFNHTFNNETALHILAIANPYFPKVRPVAADMTQYLRILQAQVRTAAESLAVVSELLPQELRGKTLDASFMKRWVGIDSYNRWRGLVKTTKEEEQGPTRTAHAVEELASLHDVMDRIHASATECVRRSGTVESSLERLEREVMALTQGMAVGPSGLDGAWATLGWRTDCRCDSGTQTSPVRVVAEPIVVVHFVPSIETLFQGFENAYWWLKDKYGSARQRFADAQKEADKIMKRLEQKPRLSGKSGVSMDLVDLEEIKASMDRKFQERWGL
ncbi:hypothetical protein QBC40DRAFT_297528 [Triangularia verruculosa]|uniref:Uncharacterized protein n=1 Tax=Triangularia verruculosa TaxID=2587418 RepID=A0AAN6XFF0_9PEZI|nr:hypothetical protein QBC40DRAFT_297528 [Triangularia verruculosa]